MIETGLGGRLDATNVAPPACQHYHQRGSGAHGVPREHSRKIAREKGGIIKQGIPVVTASDDPMCFGCSGVPRTRRKARVLQARMVSSGWIREPCPGSRDYERQAPSRSGPSWLGLPGVHQGANAPLAIAALRLLLEGSESCSGFPRLKARMPQAGLAAGQVVHGPAMAAPACRTQRKVSARRRAQSRRRGGARRVIPKEQCASLSVVFGVMKDKDAGAMLAEARSRSVVAVAPGHAVGRFPAAEVKKLAKRMGIRAIRSGRLADTGALRLPAAETLAGRARILITGSIMSQVKRCHILRNST